MRRAAPPLDPYVPERGNPGYDVTGYELDLTYAVRSNLLQGKARITAAATDDLPKLSLDLVGLRADKVSVDGRAARWSQRNGKLHVTPSSRIAADSAFAVDVRYSGNPSPTPSRWGLVGWEHLTDGILVAAQPTGAPTWFPCNDAAAQKAPFRVAVTAASGYHVVGNGELVSGRVRGSQTTWVYEQTEPTSPYLATLHFGRYDTREQADSPVGIRLVGPPALDAAVDRAFARQPEMMQVFVDRFGPYPFDAGYTVVVSADPLELPLEAQGQSIFGPNHLDGQHERLIAHELSHQWWGNSLTAAGWHDIWLHEGFACFSEWVWSEGSGGLSIAQQARVHHARLQGQPQDLVLGDPGPDDMFDDRVYKRGALVLEALRVELGDLAFFGLLQRWASTYQHGVVTTELFIALAERAAGHSLADLFGPWLWTGALPPLSEPR